jgi:predicted nucleic acid-binding Zn ribbon protein
MIPPHQVCPFCGYYKEEEVIDVFKGLTKKERKKKQKEIVEEK